MKNLKIGFAFFSNLFKGINAFSTIDWKTQVWYSLYARDCLEKAKKILDACSVTVVAVWY